MKLAEARPAFTYGSEIKAPQFFYPQAHEDLVKVLGEDYRERVHKHFANLGYISSEENLNFLDNISRHEGSASCYFLDFYKDGHRHLAGYMPPNSESTIHYHKDIIEEYSTREGELFVVAQLLKKIGKDLTPHSEKVPIEGLVVFPYIVHRAVAGNQGALTIIRMRNAAYCPEELQHIKVPSF